MSTSTPPLDPTLVRIVDEQGKHCFGCGPDNPQGLHLTFEILAEDPGNVRARAIVNLTRMHEGPPGHMHGGIIATLMDEAMSKLNKPLNLLAMTRHMEVDYLRPAPLNTPLTLESHHLRRDGRKVFHEAALMAADGTVLARAKGFFLTINPEMIAAALSGVKAVEVEA